MLYVESCFGTGFQEDQAILLGESLSLLSADLSSVVEISFVSNKHDHDVGVSILSNFIQPASQVIKGFLASDIIDQQSPSSPTVITPGDTLE